MARSVVAVERTVPELTHHQGTLLVLLTGVVFSFGGLAFRSTESATAWEYLVFRGLGMTAVVTPIFLVQNRHRLHVVRSRFQPIHVFAGVVLGAMNMLFIVSLEVTSVAFVLFLQPAAPVAAAYFSWLVMRERVSRVVAVSTVITFVGVAVMVSGTIVDDALSPTALIALSLPLLFGFYTTTIRAAARIDPLVPVVAGGVSLTVVSLGVAVAAGGLDITLTDAGIGFFAGSVLLGLPVAVFNIAQRVVPASETTLLLMIEVLLAPIWVWAFVDEQPATSTLAGGAIILGAVGWLTISRTPRQGRSFSSRG